MPTNSQAQKYEYNPKVTTNTRITNSATFFFDAAELVRPLIAVSRLKAVHEIPAPIMPGTITNPQKYAAIVVITVF